MEIVEFKGVDEKRVMAITVLLAISISLAGCGILGSAGISDPQIQVSQQESPVMTFNYSVDDYSTALLEGPYGEVVHEERLEPDKTRAALPLRSVEAGQYSVVLQQGGDTIAEKELTYDGADPVQRDLSVQWSGNKIRSITATIGNEGDLPLRVSEGTFTARGDSIEDDGKYEWIAAGENESVTFQSSYGGTITVEEEGEVKGQTRIETSDGTLESSFEKKFEGANLTVSSVSQNWDGNTLVTVNALVKNTGDLPTQANLSVLSSGEERGTTWDEEIGPGSSYQFEISSYRSLYEATSGGNISVDLLINTPSEYQTETFTHYIEPTNISLTSISPNWQGSELQTVDFTVSNTGDISREIEAELLVNGQSVQEWSPEISEDSSQKYRFETQYGLDPLYTANSGGEMSVTVSLEGGSTDISKTVSNDFEGVQGSISEVSADIYGNYDSDSSDLSAVDFRVRNSGDVTMTYDAVRLTIDGTSRTDSLYAPSELEPGASERELVTLIDGITVDNGNHQLEIDLLNGGDTVKSETVSVTAGD